LDAGYAKVVDATSIVAGKRSDGKAISEPDLVILPYREFMVPMHFGASPHVYVPIWRSLRLALDA
jgi:hypothetical protein